MVPTRIMAPRMTAADGCTLANSRVSKATADFKFMASTLSGSKLRLHGTRLFEFFQQLRIDIAAADDRDMQTGLGQLLPVKQVPGNGHRATGFRDGSGIGGQQPYGLADLELADSYDVVHVRADVFKINGADTLAAQAIGDGTGRLFGRGLGNLSGTEAGLRIGRKLGFDPDDVDGRLAEFNGCGNATDHASAAYRHQHGLDDRQIFQNFQADSALSGDDFLVVEGRDDGVALPLGKFFGALLALHTAGPD